MMLRIWEWLHGPVGTDPDEWAAALQRLADLEAAARQLEALEQVEIQRDHAERER